MTTIQGLPDAFTRPPQDIDAEKAEGRRKWHQRLSRLFGRDDNAHSRRLSSPVPLNPDGSPADADPLGKRRSGSGLRFPRQVIPGLPRAGTFRRQQSERRERLSPSHVDHLERRTLSVDRNRDFHYRTLSPAAFISPRISAPAFCDAPDASQPAGAQSSQPFPPQQQPQQQQLQQQPQLPQQPEMDAMPRQRPTSPPTPPPDELPPITAELEQRWILNLSMHFRDKSPREKFFITFAETPTRWRRVTVSCDYRNAPADSLEADLRRLQYQREKSARIYEAIRCSLPDIQFYETVTNLRLETSADERLHVHVTEDVNEIIPYPDKHLLRHLDYCRLKIVSESQVHFISHMSGFVYKVKVDGEILIKKEIPGPDSVEEFLYEINALNSLLGSQHVVQIRGLVYDESQMYITGLLIDYYENGPLVDVLFDFHGKLSWERKEKWAIQIIKGLDEIHEAGYVQGDFTVSNICIGADDNARIIDINRRGCPVGWEPPDIARMIESGQRISMYISNKTDLFQLGMVMWAIAMEDDEPERRHRPLELSDDPELCIPDWYRDVTHRCLESNPADRPSASRLLSLARQSPAMTRMVSSTAVSSHQALYNSGMLPDTAAMAAPYDMHFIPDENSRLKSRSPSRSRVRSRSRSRSPSPFYEEERRGRSPPRNTAHLDEERRREFYACSNQAVASDMAASSLEPEVVSIAPQGTNLKEGAHRGRPSLDQDQAAPAATRPNDQAQAPTTGTTPATDAAYQVSPPPPEVPMAPDAPQVPRGNAFLAEAFGMPNAPEVPEVPEAPEPLDRPDLALVMPESPLPSFHHVDSGFAEMNQSRTDLTSQSYWRHNTFGSRNSTGRSSYEYLYYPGSLQHHDSGLAGMDLDIMAGIGGNEELQRFTYGYSPGKRESATEANQELTEVQEEPEAEARMDSRSEEEERQGESMEGEQGKQTRIANKLGRDIYDEKRVGEPDKILTGPVANGSPLMARKAVEGGDGGSKNSEARKGQLSSGGEMADSTAKETRFQTRQQEQPAKRTAVSGAASSSSSSAGQ